MSTAARRWAIAFASLLVLLASVSSVVAQTEPPVLPKGKGERCVEPTEVMRRDHMRFLLHQRDRTVREGIRTKRHSLAECVACHAVPDDRGEIIRVDTAGQFCESCHAYTGVKMDCFECHAAKPIASAYMRPVVTPGGNLTSAYFAELVQAHPFPFELANSGRCATDEQG